MLDASALQALSLSSPLSRRSMFTWSHSAATSASRCLRAPPISATNPMPSARLSSRAEALSARLLRAMASAYFEVAFFTGMRSEELIALRWCDIDWNDQTIRVERARTAGELKPLKTYNARDIDLVSRALAALQTMKPWTMWAAWRLRFFRLWKRTSHYMMSGANEITSKLRPCES